MDNANEATSARARIGSLGVYFFFLYTGFPLSLSALLYGDLSDGPDAMVAMLGLILLVVATVYLMVLLYRIWSLVIRESRSGGLQPSVDSPGKAVGLLFVPIFNFYWVFVAIGKLPRDLNAVARTRGVAGTVPVGLGYAIAILSVLSVIPFVGYVTSLVASLVLMPLLVTRAVELCWRITLQSTAGDETVEFPDAAGELASIRNWPDLFRGRGVHVRVGAAYFVGLLAASLVINRWGFSLSFFADLVIYAVAAAAFVAVNSLVRRIWLLPPIWGLVWAILLLGKIAVGLVGTSDVWMNPLRAILFMIGLIVATRVWGVRIWSLPVGLAAAFVAWLLIWFTLRGVLQGAPIGLQFFMTRVPSFVVGQTVMGVSLYVGFFLQAQAEGFGAMPKPITP